VNEPFARGLPSGKQVGWISFCRDA